MRNSPRGDLAPARHALGSSCSRGRRHARTRLALAHPGRGELAAQECRGLGQGRPVPGQVPPADQRRPAAGERLRAVGRGEPVRLVGKHDQVSLRAAQLGEVDTGYGPDGSRTRWRPRAGPAGRRQRYPGRAPSRAAARSAPPPPGWRPVRLLPRCLGRVRPGPFGWRHASVIIRRSESNASGRSRTLVTHTASPSRAESVQVGLPVLLLIGEHDVRAQGKDRVDVGVLGAADPPHAQVGRMGAPVGGSHQQAGRTGSHGLGQ